MSTADNSRFHNYRPTQYNKFKILHNLFRVQVLTLSQWCFRRIVFTFRNKKYVYDLAVKYGSSKGTRNFF